MSEMSKIAVVKELLDSAHKKMDEAKKLLSEVTGETIKIDKENFQNQAILSGAAAKDTEEGKVIEGIFNGQEMVDAEGNIYPVPVNYSSKSKLVSGDLLKLTIGMDGRFLYKQIGPVKRKYIVGPLSLSEGQYQVLAEGKAYKVLLASVTYFKAEIGEEVTIIVPEHADSEWAAIDAVLPKVTV